MCRVLIIQTCSSTVLRRVDSTENVDEGRSLFHGLEDVKSDVMHPLHRPERPRVGKRDRDSWDRQFGFIRRDLL